MAIKYLKKSPKTPSTDDSKTNEIVKGLLPTGIDFGPDGSMYFGDWDLGWNTNNKGRIWKIEYYSMP